jgi:hypothetical protein
MYSCSINTCSTHEVDSETIIKDVFDLSLHNYEFSITENDRIYYIQLLATESISKIECIVNIRNTLNIEISFLTYYLTSGLYHFETATKTIYIFINEDLKGYTGNVENSV